MVVEIGIIGAAIILFAFVLNQFGIWETTDFKYDLVNLIGGGLLVWYAIQIESWPFIVLNGVWTAVSLRDVIQSTIKKQNT